MMIKIPSCPQTSGLICPHSWLHSKLYENTKNYKSAYPGSNKVVYGACEQESEEKIQNLIFECAKLDF